MKKKDTDDIFEAIQSFNLTIRERFDQIDDQFRRIEARFTKQDTRLADIKKEIGAK